MGLRLSVRRQAWHHRVGAVADSLPGLIPVVKGNGYGFGRTVLMPIAARLGTHIAVGTVYEACDVPADRTAIVLTPHIGAVADLPVGAVLTVGSIAHVEALRAQLWTGDVILKLRSSMRRYGVAPSNLESLAAAVTAAGCTAISYALHLPLAGSQADHEAEVTAWLAHLDPGLAIAVSHLDQGTYARLGNEHPERSFRIRSGTALWHGDKSLLHLSADVLDVQSVSAGRAVGYRATIVPADGQLVLVAAGSAHGVGPLENGLSPFHFGRERMLLVEPAHMHTSMLFVPNGGRCPGVTDRVDVQRPLISTLIDELEWVDE